ncbi:MAG: hypothetical protein RSC15_08165 [Lactococcus sp.]
MDKSEIFESAIRELTEEAISQRKENMDESEQQLYAEVRSLSSQAQAIVRSLTEDQQKILTDYFVKTNLIADHDCQHLYVQGAKDCAVREYGERPLCKQRSFLHIGDEICRERWYN